VGKIACCIVAVSYGACAILPTCGPKTVGKSRTDCAFAELSRQAILPTLRD